MANVKQIQQMIPLITCEIPFGQDVCELVFGVDVFDLDFAVQIDSIEKPISPSHISHRWTPALDYHFDHGFIVLKHIQ